jgi:hypothetical protein
MLMRTILDMRKVCALYYHSLDPNDIKLSSTDQELNFSEKHDEDEEHKHTPDLEDFV